MARMGEIIDGKYEVLREIGRGGMSVVYLAMDKRLNKQWAIKEFRKDKDDLSKQVALKALLDEANLMKKLDHPTLPRIVDIIDNNQNVYVIMDYIEGESLNKVLDAYGAQPQEAVIEWAKQLSDVLDYLHTQNPPVIYRDMKPANVMLKPDGTVRLIDFGIAREYKEGKDGDTESIGTRGYAAPEQFGGKGQTDARTDIYSLGVTLYHLVTGKNPAEPPYEIYPIRHWDSSYSSALEWLIQKCTQLNPEDRYQSCAEVSYVLENLDKFETEYKKKSKSRFNLFLGSLICTIVFVVLSAGCFIGGMIAQKNTYDEKMANQKHVEAIAIDNERIDAYIALAQQLTAVGPTVKDGDYRGDDADTSVTGSVTTGDLDYWFKSERMEQFLEDDPEGYARIQFELGYLMWERYTSDDGTNQDSEVIKKTNSHFEKVINVAASGVAGEYAGLAQNEFELAKIIYSVTYFQNNRNQFNANKDLIRNDTVVISEAAKFIGIDEDEYKTNPYKVFWEVMLNTVQSIEANPNISSPSIKVKVLKRTAYIFSSTYTEFFGAVGVDVMDAEKFVTSFKVIYDSITDSEYTSDKLTIKDDLNRAIHSINQNYDTDMEAIK